MFESIIAGATSFLSGGALGIFGSLGTGLLSLLKAKNNGKKEVELLKAKLAILQKGGTAAVDIIKLGEASYTHDKATYGGGWVDKLRGCVRPAIVGVLLILSIIISIWSLFKVGLDTETTKIIAKHSIFTCLNLTGIAVGFYFGARENKKIG